MAKLSEFQAIKASWDSVDQSLGHLTPLHQSQILHCLTQLDSITPIIQTIQQRNPQAAAELLRATNERKKKLNELTEIFINQEGNRIQGQLTRIKDILDPETVFEQSRNFFRGNLGEGNEAEIYEIFAELSEMVPTILEIGYISGEAARELGGLSIEVWGRIKALSLDNSETEFRLNSKDVEKQDLEATLQLFGEFDGIFKDLERQFESDLVENAYSVLSKILEAVGHLSQVDPEFGNQLSLAYEERANKLKFYILAESLIPILSLFVEFDQFFPSITQSNDIQKVNQAIHILNETSPKINTLGPSYPLLGNHFGNAYNLRMKGAVALGENFTKK